MSTSSQTRAHLILFLPLVYSTKGSTSESRLPTVESPVATIDDYEEELLKLPPLDAVNEELERQKEQAKLARLADFAAIGIRTVPEPTQPLNPDINAAVESMQLNWCIIAIVINKNGLKLHCRFCCYYNKLTFSDLRKN